MRFSRLRVQSSRYNLIRNSVFFDKTYYLASNPDVAAAKIDPVVHYLQFGGREGRNPGPVFSEAQYRALSPDVAATPLSALEHYESVGREEGRRVVAPKMRPPEVPGEAEVTQTAAPAETAAGNLASGEALYRKRCQLSLFRVRTEGPISFSPRAEPFFSVVVSTSDDQSRTVRVLELLEHAESYANAKTGAGIEVILVEPCSSTDATIRWEEYAAGVVFRTMPRNMGFAGWRNFGATLASGAYLVFLDSEVEFEPEIFVRLHDAIVRDKGEVACFGATILRFDGSIQDLSSAIWRDGEIQHYFRDEPPTQYALAYPRDVDTVARGFSCVSTADFRSSGGFNESFLSTPYDQAELSLRLWSVGRRSRIYPDIRLYHVENPAPSSKAGQSSPEAIEEIKSLFVERNKILLEERPEYKPNAGYPVRRRDVRPRVLFIELRVPALARGMGYGRSEIMVRALLKVADVDIFAHHPRQEHSIPADFDYLNLAYGPEPELLEQQLSARRYDLIYVCRPRAVSVYEKVLSAWKRGGGRVVYDTESIYAVREIAEDGQAESYGAIANDDRFADLFEKELRPAQVADVVVAVTETEAQILRERLDRPVFTIGHYLPVRPLGRDPAARSGLFFVGSLWRTYGPNYESLVWFLDHVWPRLRAARPAETLRVGGFVGDEVSLEPLAREGVACLGPVPDLTGEFARARLFIAPTRFAAGVPFKVHEAFSYGLPAVTSLLLAEQLARLAGT